MQYCILLCFLNLSKLTNHGRGGRAGVGGDEGGGGRGDARQDADGDRNNVVCPNQPRLLFLDGVRCVLIAAGAPDLGQWCRGDDGGQRLQRYHQ